MIFLDLGNQPFANSYQTKFSKTKERKYRLLIDYNIKNNLVSIKKRFSSQSIFNNNYPYRSSMSKTMRISFKQLAQKIKKTINPSRVLEIGCNDGSFLENFNNKNSIGIEPCKNIAKISKSKKINVIDEYWNFKLAKSILEKYGKFDLIYSANTITHIPNLNEVFKSIRTVLDEKGVLIIEDPSLLECINKNAYDHFYNEHFYVFSYLGLSNVLKKNKLKIYKVENIDVHGGSLRYYIVKENLKIKIQKSVNNQKKLELRKGLHKLSTYQKFAKKIQLSKKRLKKIFKKIKDKKEKIIGYGATAKSVTVLNYCKINSKIIDFFLDTTPEKQNKLMPGLKIPVKAYDKKHLKNIKFIFLGAWNFEKEIKVKEKKFIKSGGKFFTHIPFPRFIN